MPVSDPLLRFCSPLINVNAEPVVRPTSLEALYACPSSWTSVGSEVPGPGGETSRKGKELADELCLRQPGLAYPQTLLVPLQHPVARYCRASYLR